MSKKYVCLKCGSEDIQVRQWVNPNTHKQYKRCEGGSYRQCWCENCQMMTQWIPSDMYVVSRLAEVFNSLSDSEKDLFLQLTGNE